MMGIKHLVLALVLTMGLITSTGGEAQVAVSRGCDVINSDFFDDEYNGGQTQKDFFSGERLEFTSAAPVTSGEPTETRLFINSVQVDSDGFPGTVTYQFTSDENAVIQWSVNGGTVQWTASCFAAAEPETAAPIPALNWQGIAVLVAFLTGFAYYRRRKVTG